MLQALDHPVAHQVVPDPADGPRGEAHFGCGDRGGPGSTRYGKRQLFDRIATAAGRISVNGQPRQSNV